MASKFFHAQANKVNQNSLYKVSGTSALLASGLFLLAAIDLMIAVLGPGTINDWLSPFQNNWLIVIFKLHAGFNGVQSSLLDQLNVLDIVILALIATMYIGLCTLLRRTSKVWSLIALVQPILGLMLLIATNSAGRSSVMGAELVISVVMLRSKLFDKRIAYMGILSGALLLAGDLGASMSPSKILAILMGVGYTLLVIWFFLVGRRLLQLEQQN
jgi:hypothetical protein